MKTLCHFGPSWSEVATQLPDKLSESKILANSSGIKNNFCSICAEVKTGNSLCCLRVKFVRTNSLPSWREVGSKCKTYSQVGNNFDQYFDLSQIGKQCKPVQVHKFASSVNRALFTLFAHFACWGNIPNPLRTSSCDDGCSFILNVSVAPIFGQLDHKLEFAFLENNSAASCGEVEVSRWDRLRQTCDFSTGEVY